MEEFNRNSGLSFESCCQLLKDVSINLPSTEESVFNLCQRRKIDKPTEIASLLRAITCIDLTTLCGDDSESNVQRLCQKALQPIDSSVMNCLRINPRDFHVAAVCVYPAQVQDCVEYLKRFDPNIPVASVAAGFPSSQYRLPTKLDEIKHCVKDGSKEIDIVISRDLVMRGDWKGLYEEVCALKQACGQDVHLKTIIAAGELGTLDNVYKASIVSMAAGSDFIKTSTGKESVNATLPIGITMLRAIKMYYFRTGFEIGFKPAGGIRTAEDVLKWQAVMKQELGPKWQFSTLFRIGASGLLSDIERHIFNYVTGYDSSKHLFTYL